MTEIVELVEVDWSSPPLAGDYWPRMIRCEWCHEDAGEDFREGNEPRVFFQIHGGDYNVLHVCENCVEAFLKEASNQGV